MHLTLETFAIRDMISDIAGTVDTHVRKRNNDFEIDADDDIGEMSSDLNRVRQALLNLVSNAAKFTEDGRITLAASRTRGESGREWLVFDVSDTGIGIPPEKIEMLFEEFTQADDTTTREYGGTGLGLAITRRFCELLGGTIACRSVEGEGSTFTIRLPAVLVPPSCREESEANRAEAAAMCEPSGVRRGKEPAG